MGIFGMDIIEHPSLGKDEAWIITKADAPQVPQELRGTLPIPCILTGDMAQAKNMLTLLQAIAAPPTKAAAVEHRR